MVFHNRLKDAAWVVMFFITFASFYKIYPEKNIQLYMFILLDFLDSNEKWETD
jgi:hypothetical protein